MPNIYLQNLTDTNYKRPKETYTDKIQTKTAMKEKLENYERADSIDDVEMETHVRYVTLDKERKQVFRTGGLLIKRQSQYVKLSNGRQQWSVQRFHYADKEKTQVIFETVFFYRISKHDEFNKKEAKYIDVIKRQRAEIKKLQDYIKNIT
tara:strand:- start:313 stop:762 length:450 start_codon:yes stop_codon:yes gene_type:complete